MKTGKRVWQSEVSLIDTTLLLAGVLTVSVYFSEETPSENEIRKRADAIYRRVDWQWARGGGTTVRQGWKPESGFLHYGWGGYDEAIILYVLGLASPTHPFPESSYTKWTATYQWENIYDYEFLYAGPLFIHHFSQAWIDFAGIRDRFMREKKATISKTAGAPLMFSANTRGAIRSGLKAMARIAGALRQTTDPVSRH